MIMSHFKRINNLPILNLEKELTHWIQSKTIYWPDNNQICINTLSNKQDDWLAGTGSLHYDWTNKQTLTKDDGTHELKVPLLANTRKESDFDTMCSVFKNTLFETVYDAITQNYKVGRIRLMKMKPKTCLSWHMDLCARVHYPIKTQDGCMMIIDQQVCHMPANTWWYTDTHKHHTAINASRSDRIHLVCSVLE